MCSIRFDIGSNLSEYPTSSTRRKPRGLPEISWRLQNTGFESRFSYKGILYNCRSLRNSAVTKNLVTVEINEVSNRGEDGLFHPRFCFTLFLEDFGYESVRDNE